MSPQHKAGESGAPSHHGERASFSPSLIRPKIGIVPLVPPTRVDLDGLAPWVRQLVNWLGPGPWSPTLVGLVNSAPSGLLDDVECEPGEGRVIPVPWTLNSVVRHALLPLAELSLVDGQPVIPELGADLVDVLADPRLGWRERYDVESALYDSEDLEGVLAAEARGSAAGPASDEESAPS